MTTDEANKFLITLKSQATKRSELKVYDDFIQTLTKLSKRDLSIENIISIESKLDELKLKSNDRNKKKYFRKALNSFKEYLKREFSLVSKGYYTAIGMSLGMCFGISLGIPILKGIGTPIGLVSGMLIGLIIGVIMDTKAEKEGRVL